LKKNIKSVILWKYFIRNFISKIKS